MISMSKLPRVENCPSSEVLPAVRHIPDEEPKGKVSMTTLGSVVHDYLKNVSLHGVEAALEMAEQEFRTELEGIDVSRLPACQPESYAVEVAFAWDYVADTGRELFRGSSSRDYSSATATEICGTADVVGLTADAVVIIDYKRGYKWLGPAAESLQLVGLAIAASRAYGRSKAHVAFARILPDGEARYIRDELDMLDLDAGVERIRAIIDAVEQARLELEAGESPELVEGSHCRYCPAFGTCPAKASLARALLTGFVPDGVEAPVLTAENFPKVLERWEAAGKVLERVKESLDTFARGTPVDLGDGEKYGPTTANKDAIDPLKGGIVLAVEFGQTVANDAVEQIPQLTKKALELALKTWMEKNPGHRIGKTMERAMAVLRKGGAVTVTTTYPVKRYRPKPELVQSNPKQEATP